MTETTLPGRRPRPSLLLSPWAVLAGMVAGLLIGLSGDELIDRIYPIGRMYLAFLQMCVLPIMVSAVVASLARLFASPAHGQSLRRFVGLSFVFLLFASCVGIVAGLLGTPGGALDPENSQVLGQLMDQRESQELAVGGPSESSGNLLLTTIIDAIPSNIFHALVTNHSLQVLVFALCVGIALGWVPAHQKKVSLDVCDALFEAFNRLIMWAMHLLPLGLACLVAHQIDQIGLELLIALLRLVVIIYICVAIFLIIGTVLISWRLRQPVWRVIWELRDTLLIAGGTRNGFAAMPAALRGLHQGLGLDGQTTNLVVPLGITICRYGTVMCFAVASLFMAQVYGVELNLASYLIVFIGAPLAAVASAGTPGTVALSMMAIVLGPLDLPLDAAFVFLLAIDPLTDPVLTVANVHGTCVAAAVGTPKAHEGVHPLPTENGAEIPTHA